MPKQALLFASLLCLAACKNDDKKPGQGEEVTTTLGAYFSDAVPSYQLSDTALMKAGDTTTIPAALVSPLIADSIRQNYFGKKAAIKYQPLARLLQKGKETYYVVKASAGQKQAAFLLAFDAKNEFGASYPLLLPDANPATSQSASIDKKFTITKSTVLREGADVVGEGKEVVAYEPAGKSFGLIMTDMLNDKPAMAVNPIDTFPKTNALAGDYYLNKKNIVAVRDGRHANQLLVYIHTENEAGDCIGQLKGEFITTSSTTAAYRQAGDPCVLNLNFKSNTVSLSEQTGCGNYRGLDCPLTGTFTRKKQQTAKPSPAKPRRR